MIDISIPNLQILANAGSGKTHTLVTRIIRLLAMGVKPRQIIALTFTRKAAGEFLTKLLQRLATAALDPGAAVQLSEAIGEHLDSANYLKLLGEVVQHLGRLQLTTLDSFFHRIVAAFPQGLGLPGIPSLLDTHAKELAANSSLRHALAKLTKQERDLLIQSLFERDEDTVRSSVSKELNSMCQEAHEFFLDHPEIGAWGHPSRIWDGATNPWEVLSHADRLSCIDIVERERGAPEFSADARKAWLQLQHLSRGVAPNSGIAKIMASFPEWKSGAGKFFHRKSYEISFEASVAAAALVGQYLHECTEYRLRETSAIHHLLSHYEEEYEAHVRGQGKLSFSDVTRLLQPVEDFTGIGRNSRTDSADLRLQLDERIDALFDHWLLDEFQDTSRSQYRALENILDEVISEAARGGERSFFCVGDIKQAIYGWRQGDSRLFDELYDRYKTGGGLERAMLNTSWRSSREILSTLNAVFGDLDTTAISLPESVRQRWNAAWTHHLPGSAPGAMPGFFSWKSYDPSQEANLEDQVVELLRPMQSLLKKGLTIALLVRSGKEARQWQETLRHAGIEALSESTPPVGRDNPVAAALRSALSLSVHSGDLFALNHLSMEPLRGCFFPSGDRDGDLALLVRRSAELLAEGGFAAVTKWITEKLAPLMHDEFSKERTAALHRAARKADSSGITSVDDFLTLLESYEEQGRSAPHAVQIMTIHKAKGLEYDMVLIPMAGSQKALDSLTSSALAEHQNARGETFLMKLPSEEIRNVPGNETLALAAQSKRFDGAFEELCVWYVALSRAKRALYVLSPESKKLDAGKCPNFPQLLKAGLEKMPEFSEESPEDTLLTLGDPAWYEKFQPRPAETFRDLRPRTISIPPRAPSLKKSSPSDSAHHVLRGDQAFLPNNATALGSEIHALFESIEWLPASLPDAASPEARDLMLPCLEHPSIQELFCRPPGHFTLWREQCFDLVLGGEWISGCFDRVVIFRDTQGRAISADLIDFKTDQGGRGKLIANYRPQMETYRLSLSRILHLPEEMIRMILIHLRSSDPVVEV